MNYFSQPNAAERYAKGRPNFHGITVNNIKNFLKLENKVNNALDIACSTGLSSQALLAISNNIYGTDSSQAMLNFALQKNKIKYQIAYAEVQPFEDGFFELITVGSGVHWFDIDKFLLEAHRLLQDKTWLVLYDNYFTGEMENNIEFIDWYKTVYLKKFPAPLRNDSYDWTKANLVKKSFEFTYEEKFKNRVVFNMKELSLYFTTQSNIISAVENKLVTYEEVENWLEDELSKFFPKKNEEVIIYYDNWVKYIQKR
jgi:ubiquinone/menaquinone biosynthesis C-methylase UbiE